MKYVVSIVGRPNVGKSTLFNRLIEQNKAITEDTSGITRDRHYGTGNWRGNNFTLIDTGGFVMFSKDIFEKKIAIQVKEALEESNLILFVVDTKDGLLPADEELANLLRTVKTPVLLVINKADNYNRTLDASNFYTLGFEKSFPIAAISGYGTGELLDEVIKQKEEFEKQK